MATQNNTIKTRIQLKSDTEANWNKAGPKEGSNGFVPLSGELIVYTPDATHPFSRLKVGDGTTNVVNLPFIDAGTLNGELLPEDQVIMKNSFAAFPSPGSENKLYIDLSTNRIYCFTNAYGYHQLSNFSLSLTKVSMPKITSWSVGALTTARVNDNTLVINNGLLPKLNYYDINVVTDVQQVVNNT